MIKYPNCRHRFIAITGCLLASSLIVTAAQGADGWVSLFDGKTLEGWTQKNGTATYEVVGNTIKGTTSEGSPNSFLCSNKEYGDFELEFEVKVHNNLNSGVQIRSTTAPIAERQAKKKKNNKNDKKKKKRNSEFGRVNGPQVEIEASGENGAEAGYIYGEATGRGWLTPESELIPHKHFTDGQWNQFRVVADGNHIQTWINGTAIADLVDDEILKTHPRGFIGLQVHGIKAGDGPYDVSWRNIRIKER